MATICKRIARQLNIMAGEAYRVSHYHSPHVTVDGVSVVPSYGCDFCKRACDLLMAGSGTGVTDIRHWVHLTIEELEW